MNNRFANFDVLRIFLAMEVVCAHLLQMSIPLYWHIIPAVPCFVCLSGFLIPDSFTASRGWGHFAWKRALRILPALIVSFIVIYAWRGWAGVRPTLIHYLSAGLIATATINGPLWSLVVEEVLYTFHALSRVILRRWTPTIAISCLVLCIIARFTPIPLKQGYWSAICCFFLGNILSFYKPQLQRFNLRYLWLLLPLIALGYLYRDSYMWVHLPICALTVIGAYRLPQLKIHISDISYGCYIYHMPITLYLTRQLHIPHGSISLWLLVISLTIITATLSWRLVESQALRLKSIRLQPSRNRAPVNHRHTETPLSVSRVPQQHP